MLSASTCDRWVVTRSTIIITCRTCGLADSIRRAGNQTMKRTGIILVILYGTVVSGLPLPLAKGVSGKWVRFPCENSSCGCASAVQCWKSCCCNTLEEKIAWAKANGVPVPEHVVSRAETAASCCAASKAGGGCGTMGQRIEKKSSLVGLVCCDHSTMNPCQSHQPQNNKGEPSNSRSIRLIAALGCGGQPDGFPGLIPSLPPFAVSQSPRPDVEKSFDTLCELISCFSLPPATPPPQCG